MASSLIHCNAIKTLEETPYSIYVGIPACRLDIHGKGFALQSGECEEVGVKPEDIAAGKFSLVYLHPEAVFNSTKGQELLESDEFRARVTAVVVDECHKVEEWQVNYVVLILMVTLEGDKNTSEKNILIQISMQLHAVSC